MKIYDNSLRWMTMAQFVARINKNGYAPILPDKDKECHYELLIEAYMACVYADFVYCGGGRSHNDLKPAFESAFGRLRLLGVMTSNDESDLRFKDYDEQVFMLDRLIMKASKPKQESAS